MPATNYTPIQLYRTATATGTAPVAGNLNFGELAINYNDGGMLLYAKNASGTIIKLMNNPANLLYPRTDGTSGQAITTNGSGTLAFSSITAAPGGSTTQVQYNNAGAFGGISNATTDGTTLSMTSPKVITGINDTNGNELLKVTATASAVNELTLANAATGGNPVLSATGGDTNIGITLTPKGTGGVVFPAGAVGTPAITTTGDTNTGVYFSAADEISFATGGSQRVKIGTADLTISNGNLVIGTSGKGIDFSATAGTGTSELLNDYEEGTWTPTLKEGTNTLTAGTNGGYYTKIGNQVTVWINIQDINKSGSGNLSITGLPFSANAANDRFISGAIAFNRIDIPAGIGSPYANIPNYSSLPTTLYLFWNTDGNTNGQQWTAADLADNTSADIAFTLTYFV